jgi:hypothetical protein
MNGRWIVRDGINTGRELFVIETLGNGALSLHIPTHQPVVVAWLKVEEIRLLLGVAIGQASTNPAQTRRRRRSRRSSYAAPAAPAVRRAETSTRSSRNGVVPRS